VHHRTIIKKAMRHKHGPVLTVRVCPRLQPSAVYVFFEGRGFL